MLNDGDGTFATAGNYGVGYGPWSVFSADLDGDSDFDLAVANMVSDNVSILMNLTICCVGNRGNVDYDPSGNVDVSDVTYLVAYLKGLGPEPLCEEEGDVNGSGTINVADLTYLVAYLKGLGAALPACP